MIRAPPVPPLHKHTRLHSYLMFIFLSCSPLGSLLFHCVCVYQTLQDTLAYATALLNEKEQSGSSNGSDGSPANENADRSLRQVALNFIRVISCSRCTVGFLHESLHYSSLCSVHAAKKRRMA